MNSKFAMPVGALLLLPLQHATAQDVTREQVIIVAPYITHETQNVIGPRNKGVYDVNTLTKQVSYADLDLSKPADADLLMQRISDTAKQSCAELKATFPDPPHAPVLSDQDCVKQATDQAMLVATSLISRAQVAMATPAPARTAEVTPPEPAPQVEAQATEVPPAPPKQDRN
jgi:UrcA family protein